MISENEYENNIKFVREILKGKLSPSKEKLKIRMNEFSKKLEFENAQKVKEKIQLLENYQFRSTVVSSKLNNIDVFSIISDQTHAYVNYLQVAYGRVIRFHNIEIKKKLDEPDNELLLISIINLREKFQSENKTIISNIAFENILDF